MTNKTWTIRCCQLIGLVLLLVLCFNLYSNTRWRLEDGKSSSYKRMVSDERQQKTNFMVHHSPAFSNLILGSSRASYLPSTQLSKLWFNYGTSGMYPDEYSGYIANAQQYAIDQKIDTILIGLDFWATTRAAIVIYDSPKVYLENATNFWIEEKKNLSLDLVKEGIKQVRLNISPKSNEAYYTFPFLIKNRTSSDVKEKDQLVEGQLNYYKNDVYNNTYAFDSSYFSTLERLCSQFPSSTFIFYISPVSPPLDDIILSNGFAEKRHAWIQRLRLLRAKIIYVPSSNFSSDDFFDSHHLKPECFAPILKQVR